MSVATLVAIGAAVTTGILRIWIWIAVLEPLAMGVVIGEAAAIPSSARHRRPPRWTYGYILLLGGLAYVLAHLTFWLSSGGAEAASFVSYLSLELSASHGSDLSVGRPAFVPRGYWLWIGEGTLMGLAAMVAYWGGSLRKLKT